ncbi:MAG: hypothetical protein CM1200mP38_2600 [Dehalococcoidia bacterium]|nr:MAG: hypothetical protein CM1200mP38_2600 [Dehalococcoidia bacterium]
MERRRESETPDLYSEVYGAERPELFLKSTAERCMGPLDDIGIRTDSTGMFQKPNWDLLSSMEKSADSLAETM